MRYTDAQTNKRNNSKTKIMVVIVSIIIIIVCVVIGLWLIGRKDAQMSTDSDLNRQNIGTGATAEEYEQFEELFREYQDHMQIIKDELAASLGEGDYLILFDEERISPISGKFLRDCVKISYSNNVFVSEGNDETTKILNENTVLIEEFNFLENEGVISSIDQLSLERNMLAILFYINTEFTPFITSNNGVQNSFAFIENADCEKYGYKNIEGNWYMWISPAPE